MPDDLVIRKLRIMMPDPEKLTPDLLSACRSGAVGYILEVEMRSNAVFVGAVNVPTLLDILGGSVGGPVAYAFLEDDSIASRLADMAKRWFISVMPGIPWGLPSGFRLVPCGISATAGVLNGHFELMPRDTPTEERMGEYLKSFQEQGLIVMPSKDYAPPTTVLEALKLARGHGKG